MAASDAMRTSSHGECESERQTSSSKPHPMHVLSAPTPTAPLTTATSSDGRCVSPRLRGGQTEALQVPNGTDKDRELLLDGGKGGAKERQSRRQTRQEATQRVIPAARIDS